MKSLILSILSLLLVAGPVLADESPPVLNNMGPNGSVFLMCNADGTGVCTGPNGDEAVLDTGGMSSVVIDLSQSAATSLDCDVVGNNVGYDAENDGTILNSTALSTTQYAITFTDTPRFIWITCSTVSGGGATVTATALARRNK